MEKYDKLSKDFQTMSKEYQLFQKECEELNKARSNQINDLEKTISEVRQKYTKQNTEINEKKGEILLLEKEKNKKDEIIERISYREIGSRIISFFSLAQKEEKIKEYTEKEISSTNINIITSNIKDNLSNYYKYLKDNKIDLKHVLNEIKQEKKGYDSLVHETKKYKEKYLELMNKREKQLGTKIDFIITNSKLMDRYVFEKDKKITNRDIYQEFKDFDEELKKRFEEEKKEEDAKNKNKDF